MKRFFSALIALTLLALPIFSLFGCAGGTSLYKIDPTDEEMRVVGKVGEFDIYYDELRYLTLTYKEQMAGKYGEEIWKTRESAEPYIEELQEKVYSSITANYGALTVAKANGIDLNNSDVQRYCNLRMEEIASDLTMMLIASHGDSNKKDDDETTGDNVTEAPAPVEDYTPTSDEVNKAYRTQLESSYLTDRYVRFTFSVDGAIEQLVIKYEKDGKLYTSDEDIEQYIRSKFCRTLHIFVRNDRGESIEENRAIAELVISELEGGKSFNSMVGSKYNDDLWTTSVNGHYFGRGEMEKEYEDAAYALEEGKYSDIIETDSGFYIIRRLPLQDDYINTYFEELKTQYKYAVVNSDIAAERAKLSLALSDFGASVELWSMQ